MATKICSFCLGNDHYMRNKTIVTCPKLLVTQCNICYNFGHTTNFCKEKPKKQEKPKIVSVSVSNYSKPHSQIVKPKRNECIGIASRFAALEVKEGDTDNSSEYDCDDERENATQETKQNDYEEYDENELPPVSAIIWGKGFATKYRKEKWSD